MKRSQETWLVLNASWWLENRFCKLVIGSRNSIKNFLPKITLLDLILSPQDEGAKLITHFVLIF
jgi:hypothetical protein